jgi:phage terminase large subunit GpA-like protein
MSVKGQKRACGDRLRPDALLDCERAVLKAQIVQTVSEWARENIIVMDGPYRGAPLRVDVNPYIRDIMDCFSDKGIEQVVICGSPQTGKTLALYACMGYAVDRRVGTKMLAMPDDKNVSRVAHEKLKPMFKASALLAPLVAGTTADQIRLANGTTIFLASAQAAAQRASISVRDLFMDEEDLYASVARRGNPVMDFLERTRSFSFARKVMRVSKPVGDAKSSIWRALTKECDIINSYQVPCPLCGAAQFFQESRVEIVPMEGLSPDASDYQALVRRFELGKYRCAHCGGLFGDMERNKAVHAGRWVPSRVRELGETGIPVFEEAAPPGGRVRSVGYHLPAILSRAVSISEIAARMVVIKGTDDPEILQGQANGDWARPYIAVVTNPGAAEILARMDPELPARTVPGGAVALTMGIDTQKLGFYYLVLAWMPDMTKYIIDYGRFNTFEDVYTAVFDTAWQVQGADGDNPGGSMDVWRAAIDSGGTYTEGAYSRTEEVYEFAWKHQGYKLWPIKGVATEQGMTVRFTVVNRMPGRKTPIAGGLQLGIIDSGKVKSSLFHCLINPEARRPIKLYGHDPEREDQTGLHDELIKHLTAERQIRNTKGKLIWVQQRSDNHWLDCLMMACACGDVSWVPSMSQLVQFRQAEAQAQAMAQILPPLKPAKPQKPKRQRGW